MTTRDLHARIFNDFSSALLLSLEQEHDDELPNRMRSFSVLKKLNLPRNIRPLGVCDVKHQAQRAEAMEC